MNEQNWRKSGQIPVFGNWEYANEQPITQYFECARQAVVGGLLRYSNSSSGECHPYAAAAGGGGGGGGHHHAIDFKKPPLRATSLPPPPPKTRVSSNKRCPQKQVNEQKRQVKKVRDVAEPPRKQLSSQKLHLHKHSTAAVAAAKNSNFAKLNRRQPTTAAAASAAVVKAVDEDLYKIPPELLHKTKRMADGSLPDLTRSATTQANSDGGVFVNSTVSSSTEWVFFRLEGPRIKPPVATFH